MHNLLCVVNISQTIFLSFLQYKGVQMPALQRQTLPKTPAETSDSSPDTESEETNAKFNFDNIAADGADSLSDSYDDTLKVRIKVA